MIKGHFQKIHRTIINQQLTNRCKTFNVPKALIEYSSYMNDTYPIIDEYNPAKNQIIVFADMIADMLRNKHFAQMITELFIWRKN